MRNPQSQMDRTDKETPAESKALKRNQIVKTSMPTLCSSQSFVDFIRNSKQSTYETVRQLRPLMFCLRGMSLYYSPQWSMWWRKRPLGAFNDFFPWAFLYQVTLSKMTDLYYFVILFLIANQVPTFFIFFGYFFGLFFCFFF